MATRTSVFSAGFAWAFGVLALISFDACAEVQNYESKYFSLTSDLTAQEAREVLLRLDLLVPEITQSFPSLRGAITHRFRVSVFRSIDAMRAAGAPADLTTSGYGSRDHKAYVLVGQNFQQAMHEMQGDVFVQYCNEAIENDQHYVPRWIIVGLARHFRFARFTGDGYVSGIIPYGMVEETQKVLAQGRFQAANEMMDLSRDRTTGVDGYYSNKAWLISYYLEWGDKGAHYEAFSKYLHDVSRGVAHKAAWQKEFGDFDIETHWKEWIKDLKPEVIHERYAQAIAQTLAAYLGRAALSGKPPYVWPKDLMKAVKNDEIKMADADWLPHDLTLPLDEWMKLAGKDTQFGFSTDEKGAQVVALLSDKTKIIATFDRNRKGVRTYTQVEGPGRRKTSTIANETAGLTENTIMLKSASFGSKEHWVDVTDKCRDMIVGDMMLAPRELKDVFGINPAGDKVNWLQMHLVVNGANVRVLFPENRRFAPFRLTTNMPPESNEQ